MDTMYESVLNIKPLDASIQKLASSFECGNMSIDSFLKNPDALDDTFGKTYVWLEDDDQRIIGFYNIGTGSIDLYDENEDIRYKAGGSIHINEFAIDQKYQGVKMKDSENMNMSDYLLAECIERIKHFRSSCVGFTFITLQSTDAGHSMYGRHGFCDLEEEDMIMTNIQGQDKKCIPMYLGLDIE